LERPESNCFTYFFDDADDVMAVCLMEVYVFLGDDHALIDLVRYMHGRGLNNGEYVVIAVHDDPYDPQQQRYFNKCQSSRTTFYFAALTYLLAATLTVPRCRRITFGRRAFSV